MATGANTTPLGRLHPVLAAKLVPSDGSSGGGSKDPELKRHLEAAKRAAEALFSANEPVKKRRKSRWASDDVKTQLPGLPTVLPANMTEDQQKLYLMHIKIEEIGRMLRTGDLGIPPNPADRSPSPEPIYSHDGKRLNTREVRVKKRLEDERHSLVIDATKINPEYKAPADYRPPNKKFEDKVFIPQDHHPETNFVGLLIGPRGNTLKQLEKDTNTKIMIRGKGATKEGKLGRAGLPQPGEDEPLHALITGLTPEAVKNAVDKIKSIIQSGIDVPGNDNDLKKLQLQQLAELNGTFKPLDILRCRNCGSTGHRSWECHEQMNVTSNIICTRCGSGGHIASDCKADLSMNPPTMSFVDRAKMDSEYLSLMKELGESVPEAGTNPQMAHKMSSHAGVGVGANVPPPMTLTGNNNPQGMKIPGHRPPWMNRPPPPHHGHLHHHGGFPPHHMMMPGVSPVPWGAPPPHQGPTPLMGGLLPPPPGSDPSSSPPEGNQQMSHPWQAPQPAPPGSIPPWQQPMMYPGAPLPVGMAPPLPPGAPPPLPPDQSWNGSAPPPPPPPPPADTASS